MVPDKSVTTITPEPPGKRTDFDLRRTPWINEGQIFHQGIASKFNPGISGQTVSLDDILFTQYGLCDANLQEF